MIPLNTCFDCINSPEEYKENESLKESIKEVICMESPYFSDLKQNKTNQFNQIIEDLILVLSYSPCSKLHTDIIRNFDEISINSALFSLSQIELQKDHFFGPFYSQLELLLKNVSHFLQLKKFLLDQNQLEKE